MFRGCVPARPQTPYSQIETMAKSKKKERELHQRALNISLGLAKQYGNAECGAIHQNPFELLVATILSAQCTDERVNAVTPKLFAKYPTPEKLARSEQEDVETIIHSLGFFRAKASNIRGMAQKLVELYQGELPVRSGTSYRVAGNWSEDGQCRPGDGVRHSEWCCRRYAC